MTKEERKVYNKEYRANNVRKRNKEKDKEYSRNYYDKNRENILEKLRVNRRNEGIMYRPMLNELKVILSLGCNKDGIDCNIQTPVFSEEYIDEKTYLTLQKRK